MKYSNIREGIFISRPNRFIAKVMIGGAEHTVHVKNTGRCRELLFEGVTVYLTRTENPLRKTEYDLVAVEKKVEGKSILINIDSTAPNEVVAEWLKESGLFSSGARIIREYTIGNSRFDFYVEDGECRAIIEVKGVTLEDGGTVMFPDAPTERGVKHLLELSELAMCGYDTYVIFVVALAGARCFKPNDITHREFGESLRFAASLGVNVLAYGCIVEPDTITLDAPIDIKL